MQALGFVEVHAKQSTRHERTQAQAALAGAAGYVVDGVARHDVLVLVDATRCFPTRIRSIAQVLLQLQPVQ